MRKMQAVKISNRTRNVVKLLKCSVYFTRYDIPQAPRPLSSVNLNKIRFCCEHFRLCNKADKGVPFFSTLAPQDDPVDYVTFEKVCEETLESLTDYFEAIVEDSDNLKSADISFSGGVLTANLGPSYGTYVINRQSPNRQIWLSSPISGPKRYDFDVRNNCWVYKHDGRSLHDLLQAEMGEICKFKVDFGRCAYSKKL